MMFEIATTQLYFVSLNTLLNKQTKLFFLCFFCHYFSLSHTHIDTFSSFLFFISLNQGLLIQLTKHREEDEVDNDKVEELAKEKSTLRYWQDKE